MVGNFGELRIRRVENSVSWDSASWEFGELRSASWGGAIENDTIRIESLWMWELCVEKIIETYICSLTFKAIKFRPNLPMNGICFPIFDTTKMDWSSSNSNEMMYWKFASVQTPSFFLATLIHPDLFPLSEKTGNQNWMDVIYQFSNWKTFYFVFQ